MPSKIPYNYIFEEILILYPHYAKYFKNIPSGLIYTIINMNKKNIKFFDYIPDDIAFNFLINNPEKIIFIKNKDNNFLSSLIKEKPIILKHIKPYPSEELCLNVISSNIDNYYYISKGNKKRFPSLKILYNVLSI